MKNDDLIINDYGLLVIFFFSVIMLLISIYFQNKRENKICYKFRSLDGVVYQVPYTNCDVRGSNFICEIDNKFFQVFEYEKITCE